MRLRVDINTSETPKPVQCEKAVVGRVEVTKALQCQQCAPVRVEICKQCQAEREPR